jgi:hypothetical protein
MDNDFDRRVLSFYVLLATVLAGAFLLSILAIWQFGSITNGIAYLQGYSVVPEHSQISVGQVTSGERVNATLQLTNLSSQPVTVVGAQSNCGCIAYDDLPIELPPRSSVGIHSWFEAPRLDSPTELPRESSVRHLIRLFVNVESPPIVVTLLANIVPGPETAASIPNAAPLEPIPAFRDPEQLAEKTVIHPGQ